MALINCPECGREKVSDSAVSCPNCGFGIKAHFDNIKELEKRKKEEEEELLQRDEIAKEQKRQREELRKSRLESVKLPDKPKMSRGCHVAAVVCVLLSLLFFSWEMEYHHDQWQGALILLGVAIVIEIFSYYSYTAKKSEYDHAIKNFEQYRQQVVAQQEAMDDIEAKIQKEQWEKIESMPRCPNCGAIAFTKKISTVNRSVSVAAFGLASSKIGKQYHCTKCGHKW